MFEYMASARPRPEAEGQHSVAFWPARCARSCLRGLTAGYALRAMRAAVQARQSFPPCEPADEGGNGQRWAVNP
jgi:hypothetical protein